MSATPKGTTCDGKIHGVAHITVCYHADPSGEFTTLRSQVKEFNRRQRQVRVELVTLPKDRAYTALVLSAAPSGDLPDLLDFDGPNLFSYAWSGKLRPIDSCVPASVRAPTCCRRSVNRAPMRAGCEASAPSTRAWARTSARPS
ncbi:hypothetical protein [Streptomyces sp. SAS_276]|uniref:hypothetical protein n=1 Tax=Streptomyces sp. SAS_276 TaxID=3412745 RepID=UPI00403D501E